MPTHCDILISALFALHSSSKSQAGATARLAPRGVVAGKSMLGALHSRVDL
jgi:hypothetical protein